ncbi:MAG: Mur ligase family protein [Gammaproteobacteria bacterium]
MYVDLEGVYFGRNHYTDYPSAILVISSSTDQSKGGVPGAEGKGQRLDRRACGVQCIRVLNSLEQPIPGITALTEALSSQQGTDADYTARLTLALTNSFLGFIGAPPERLEIISTPLPAWPPVLPIAFSYDDSYIAEESARLICVLLRHIINGDNLESADDQESDFASRVRHLKHQCLIRSGTLTCAALAAAASARGIPKIKLGLWPYKVPKGIPVESAIASYQLGQGVHLQRLRNALPLPLASGFEELLTDRVALSRRLAQAGIPVPTIEQEFINIISGRRAVRAAERLGYPVVLKTCSAIDGSRIIPNLADAAAVTAAFEKLRGKGRRVVVEKQVPGDVFRFLVVGGEVKAACRRQPFVIVGDGMRSIFQLLCAGSGCAPQVINGNLHLLAFRWRLMQALKERSLDFDSVLPAGKVLRLQEGAEALATGPVPDVLDALKPFRSVLDLACNAVACLGLKAAAVEIAIQNSDRKLNPDSATVVALDPDPDLAFHCLKGEFLPLQAASLYLDGLLPKTSDLRIPIAAITGTNGKTTTCFMLDCILRAADRATGLACSDGLYIQGQRQKKGILSGIRGSLQVLGNPAVDTAILETSRGTLLEKGLAFDRCDVAACTNIAADHLGEGGVETLEQLAAVKRTVVRSARRAVVLNGEDPHCVAMLDYCTAERIYIVYSTVSPAEVMSSLGPGRYAIGVRVEGPRRTITVCSSESEMPIIDIAEIPATWNGTAFHNVQNAMFAIGLAMGLNIKPEIIRKALTNFSSSIDMTPGRLNLFDALPFKVLIDYAHNAHCYEALCRYLQLLEVPGKRTLIVYSPARQGDSERKAIAETVVGKFDAFICRGLRRKDNDEEDNTPDALRDALLEAGAAQTSVEVIPDLHQAVESALLAANAGDLVVVSATGRYGKVWEQLSAFREGKLLSDSDSNGQVPIF